MLYINYLLQLSKDIEDQAWRVHRAVKLVDQKRHELISIMQKRKTLKTIKHKEKQAYQKKLMQDERKSMDELASIRHARPDVAGDIVPVRSRHRLEPLLCLRRPILT